MLGLGLVPPPGPQGFEQGRVGRGQAGKGVAGALAGPA